MRINSNKTIYCTRVSVAHVFFKRNLEQPKTVFVLNGFHNIETFISQKPSTKQSVCEFCQVGRRWHYCTCPHRNSAVRFVFNHPSTQEAIRSAFVVVRIGFAKNVCVSQPNWLDNVFPQQVGIGFRIDLFKHVWQQHIVRIAVLGRAVGFEVAAAVLNNREHFVFCLRLRAPSQIVLVVCKIVYSAPMA